MDCLAGALLAYITANVIQSTTAITHRTHSKFTGNIALQRTSVNEIEDNYSHRSQADPEDNLRYFREDISINSHHWYWHMLNSYKWTPKAGETRDRKGELLFHMHRQVIARYDADRISCYLPAVLALQDLRKPIPEGYLPKFVNKYSSVQFMGRRPNMTLQDVPSEGLKIGTLEKWSGRILEAISSGVAMNKDGSTTDLRTPVGIDILAAMIESSASSVNADYYGNYHNLLHTALSRISNPNDHPDEFGTIAYESVAMRDPVFYRLHKTVDQLFEEYKSRLPPYTENELLFPNVAIGKIWVQGTLSEKENFLQTFWQEQEVFVNRGILFDGADPVQVKYRHLNHEEFSHNIQVTNWAKGPLDVTVRLYIAPKSDHSGKVIPFSRQRLMFIELDNYPTTINPGVQVLRRLSSESSIILPTSSMVNNLACAPSSPYYLAGDRAARGCGWPYHMLVPKGRTDGMIFTYFVMITKGGGYNEYANRTAYRYCGLLNKKYPDRESLGFPFDRTVSGSVSAIQDFASTSNMMTAEVVIQHRDLLVPSNDTEQSCSY